MLIAKRLPNPIPYQYGYPYPERMTNPLDYSAPPMVYAEPFDPQWGAHGEAGLYYDTQLGAPRRRLFSKLRARLGLGEIEPSAVPATTEDVVALMNAHNDRVFALTLVSTTAVAVSALLTVFRTLKLIREDKR